jgi:serine/threonine protein kinase
MMVEFDQVKVGDFELAKEDTVTTISNKGMGTLGYMPPEAIAKKMHRTIGLYGLAASYVRLRRGKSPFGDEVFESVGTCEVR